MSYNANEPRVPAGQPGGGEWAGGAGGFADATIKKAESILKSGKPVEHAGINRPGLQHSSGASYRTSIEPYAVAPEHEAHTVLSEGWSKIQEKNTAAWRAQDKSVMAETSAAKTKIEEAAERLNLPKI